MRIIAENHDYYDAIQAQGQDREVVYIRKESEVKNRFPCVDAHKYNINAYGYGRYRNDDPVIFYQYAVGFCGKVWPCLVAIENKNSWSEDARKAHCYTVEDVDKFVELVCKDEEVKAYNSKTEKPYWKRRYGGTKTLRARIIDFFNEAEAKRDKYQKFFEEYNAPVWIAKAGDYRKQPKVTLNAELKGIEFYKVKDAYTAFQEIYMYLASRARPQEIIPEIDDVTMAEAKGFNKFSFRKDPSKKNK